MLDTSMMVPALRSDAGASRRLLMAALERRFSLLASVPLMIEYQAVMTRSDHLAVASLSAQQVNALLDAVAQVAEPVKLAFLWRPSLRDPDDDMILETAASGGADAIVIFNQRDFGGVAACFGIDVLSPGAAWRRLETQS